MKAIIIAAGKGKRLKHYTENLPKCLLRIGEKTILEWQLEALRSSGIRDITIIRGYQAEKITAPGCKYCLNERFEFNNILNSLMCASNEIEGDVIFSYSDILYDRRVVETLLRSPHDIAAVVDTDWEKQYEGRTDHPLGEAENVLLGQGDKLIEIGKKMERKSEANGEFIGMVKLSGKGSSVFKKYYEQAKAKFWGRPFITAATFENAYVTDMLQFLIREGVEVHAAVIRGGWREIDTVADYEKARRDFGHTSVLSIR